MQKVIIVLVLSMLGLIAFSFINNEYDARSAVDVKQEVNEIVEQPVVVKVPKQPNIILFMSDDQGWGQVGYNDHDTIKTPVLDQMAVEGVQFDNFYVNASVCAPTRYGVLTGLQPTQNGCFTVQQCRLGEDTITIAEVLRDEGYVTAHFGKWHLGSLRDMSDTSPKEHGFTESYTAPNFFDSEPDVEFYHNGVKEILDLTNIDTSEFLVEKVNRFIKENVDEPMFIVVWFPSPHSPYIAQPEHKALYPGLSEQDQNKYGEISAMDSAIGSVRETLAQAGLTQETLLWFNSDNGAPVPKRTPISPENGNLRDGKNSLYEGGLRVPAVATWPGIISPAVTNEVVSSIDLFATAASLAGVVQTSVTDGVDVSSLLLEQSSVDRSEHYILYDSTMTGEGDIPSASAALIQYPYKLVRPTSGAAFELYDLERDHDESDDLMRSQSAKAVELQGLLETWLTTQ